MNLHLTPTGIKTIENCPGQWHLKRVLGDSPSTTILREGIAAHFIIAQYTAHCVSKQLDTDVKEMDSIIIANRRMLKTDEERANIAWMCRFYAENTIIPRNAHAEDTIAFDGGWNLADWDSEKLYFRGRVDMWYEPQPGEITILDYTTSRKVAHDLSETGKQTQLMTYAFMITERMKEKPPEAINLSVHNLRFNHTISATIHPEECRFIPELVDDCFKVVQRSMILNRWNYSVSDLCGYCGYLTKCPNINKYVEAGLLNTPPDDPVGMAEMLLALKAVAKEIDDGLRMYVEAHDNIRMPSGKMFGYHVTEAKKYLPRRAFNNMIKCSAEDEWKANADELLSIMSLPDKGLRKVIKKMKLKGDGEKKILACFEKSKRNNFGEFEEDTPF